MQIIKLDYVFSQYFNFSNHESPKAGIHYKWDEVKDVYIHLLPMLTDEDIRSINGLSEFEIVSDGVFSYVDALVKSKGINKADYGYRALNNYLN